MSDPATDVNVQVSHTQDGRTLSGMGTSVEQLESVMDRHAPDPDPDPKDTPAEPATAATSQEPPQLSKGRQRYADLTKERDAAKAEAAAIKAEREALAKERDDLKARLEKPAATAEPSRPAGEPAAPAPKVDKFPPFEDWFAKHDTSTYDDYLDARAAHNYAAMRANERREESTASEQQRHRELIEGYLGKFPEARQKYADFDAVVGAVPETGVSKVVAHATFTVGPDVAYYLATHREELAELTRETAMLDDTDPGFPAAVSGMRRYLQSVLAPKVAAKPAAPAVPARVPAAPYTPVNGNSATTAPPSSELARKGFDMDKSGYREKRAAERGVKSKYR